MSRSALALAVGLVCCVLLSSGLGAAAVTDGGADTAGQLDDDATVSADTTVNETTENTTETTDNTTDETTANTTEATENTTQTTADTTDTVSETTEDTPATDDTTDTVTEAADDTTDATDTPEAVETTDTPEAVETTDATGALSDTAGTTTDAVGTTSADSRAGAQDIVNGRERAVEATPTTPSTERATPGRADAAANADGNATAGAGKSGGLGGAVPSPDGKTAAVGAGVGAAVAAGAAGRAYVGSTGGSPQAVTGLARTGAPMARSLPRLLVDRTWRYIGAAGYVLHSGDPLDHDTRADLAAAVEDNPGAYLTELADATDASTSTVRYHLKVLEREGVLTPVKIRGKRRYFPANQQADELAAALADDATENVLRALASVGPASVSVLAEELDRDPSTVTHHLDRLQDADLVERERDGRSVSNSLAPAAAAALGPRAGEGTDSTAAGSSAGD